MAKRMKTYTVDITRLGMGTMPITVKAASYKEAKEKACDEAGNHVFSEDSSEYLTEHDRIIIGHEGEPDYDFLLRLILDQKEILPLLLGLDEKLDAMIDKKLKSGGDNEENDRT